MIFSQEMDIGRKSRHVINKNGETAGGFQNENPGIPAGGSNSSPLICSAQKRLYECGRILGNGSFGVVCEAKCLSTQQTVAIKKVLQDPRYKNRELDIMKELKHPNIVLLRDYYYTNGTVEGAADGEDQKGVFLNVVMDYLPDTVHRVLKSYSRNRKPMPLVLVKLYIYQLCRALSHLHALGICHRDIKPQNLLVDSNTQMLKLCDFGSAKRLTSSESSVAYICSRFYRAPELMLGSTAYTTAIDVWSTGCVFGELLLGRPLFPGDTSVDQLVKIIQVLGTPTAAQMQGMNPNYVNFKFPDVRPREWSKLYSSCPTPPPPEAFKLLSALLQYEPTQRLKPIDALASPFFDELRSSATLPGGSSLPSTLFQFTQEEISTMSDDTREALTAGLSNNARKLQT